MGRKNPDSPKWIEDEKIRVARNDVIRMAGHSDFEILVVLGITTNRYLFLPLDPFGLACLSC